MSPCPFFERDRPCEEQDCFGSFLQSALCRFGEGWSLNLNLNLPLSFLVICLNIAQEQRTLMFGYLPVHAMIMMQLRGDTVTSASLHVVVVGNTLGCVRACVRWTVLHDATPGTATATQAPA